jgi:hypothetical protein
MSITTKSGAPRRAPRTPAAKGRRARVTARRGAPHPYAVMVYRLSLAILATIVILNVSGRH